MGKQRRQFHNLPNIGTWIEGAGEREILQLMVRRRPSNISFFHFGCPKNWYIELPQQWWGSKRWVPILPQLLILLKVRSFGCISSIRVELRKHRFLIAVPCGSYYDDEWWWYDARYPTRRGAWTKDIRRFGCVRGGRQRDGGVQEATLWGLGLCFLAWPHWELPNIVGRVNWWTLSSASKWPSKRHVFGD